MPPAHPHSAIVFDLVSVFFPIAGGPWARGVEAVPIRQGGRFGRLPMCAAGLMK